MPRLEPYKNKRVNKRVYSASAGVTGINIDSLDLPVINAAVIGATKPPMTFGCHWQLLALVGFTIYLCPG